MEKSMQRHLTVFLNVRSLDEKMPNNGTKTLAGGGSAIAPDNKAFGREGLDGLDENVP
jgi:hypothetical protein